MPTKHFRQLEFGARRRQKCRLRPNSRTLAPPASSLPSLCPTPQARCLPQPLQPNPSVESFYFRGRCPGCLPDTGTALSNRPTAHLRIVTGLRSNVIYCFPPKSHSLARVASIHNHEKVSDVSGTLPKGRPEPRSPLFGASDMRYFHRNLDSMCGSKPGDHPRLRHQPKPAIFDRVWPPGISLLEKRYGFDCAGTPSAAWLK